MAGATDPLAARRLTALARRAKALYPLREVRVTCEGARQPYIVALPADPDAPLDRFAAVLSENTAHSEQQNAGLTTASTSSAAVPSAAQQARQAVASGAHMPYWALLWPSGLALAEALLTNRETLRRANALELGCGLGATAIAAIDCGTTLTATDCFAEALLFTRYNARRNTGREPRTLLADWRGESGRTACVSAGRVEVLLAADVLYEEEDIAPLMELALRVLAPGGVFWLAEPGRRVSRRFVEVARAREWRDDERVYERAWPPDGEVVCVSVHRFTKIH